MCRRAFTTTAVGLKTPKRCEVNVRTRNSHETLCDLSHKVNVTMDGVEGVRKIDSDILSVLDAVMGLSRKCPLGLRDRQGNLQAEPTWDHLVSMVRGQNAQSSL